MGKLDIDQDTEAWHELRKTKLGASDVASVLNISPYRNAYQLWQEKVGIAVREVNLAAVSYGKQMEPELLDRFCEEENETYYPNVYVSDDYEYLMASLDGINIAKSAILEIKCCNKDVFEKALSGDVVPHYYAQIQAQLVCVPSAEFAFYHCYHNGKTKTMKVYRDEKFIEDMLEKCDQFWWQVQEGVEPENVPIGKQFVSVEGDSSWKELFREWEKNQLTLSNAKEKDAVLRKAMIEKSGGENIEGFGCKLQSYEKKGSVDYSKVSELDGVNLDQYRKKSSVCWRITHS